MKGSHARSVVASERQDLSRNGLPDGDAIVLILSVLNLR
jgi:hypothetical protein